MTAPMLDSHVALGRSGTLWAPRASRIVNSSLAKFIASVGGAVNDYATFHAWSANDPGGFWGALWHYARIIGSPGKVALYRPTTSAMDGAVFFPEARLNLAENLLRGRASRIAAYEIRSGGKTAEMTMETLRGEVGRIASGMKQAGIRPGMTVAAWMPPGLERLATLIATFAIGATWLDLDQNVPPEALAERLGEMRPTLLFIDERGVGGARRSRLLEALPGIATVVSLGRSGDATWEDFGRGCARPRYRRFPFNHPAAILFVGTTNAQPVVHSAGGMLLTHLKEHLLHCDLKAESLLCVMGEWSPMMRLWHSSALATGASIAFDGRRRGAKNPKAAWRVIDTMPITHLGMEPGFLGRSEAFGCDPKSECGLRALRVMLVSARGFRPEQFQWVYEHVKSDLMLAPLLGSPAVCGHYFLGSPLHPVRRGELTARTLGMALHVVDQRRAPVIGRRGSLVCSEPFPTLPKAPPGGESVWRNGSEDLPGLWAEGIEIELTPYGAAIQEPPAT